MPYVDLAFSIVGSEIPVDHGYALFSALSRIVPGIHSHVGIGIHSIRGTYSGNGVLTLSPYSRLTVRLEAENIHLALPLSGQSIRIQDHELHVGVPRIYMLSPAANLQARTVTIKGFMEPEGFGEALLRQLGELEVVPQEIQLLPRRSLRIQDKRVVGFPVRLIGLTAEESIRVQEQGLGGRRRFGCGVFVPLRDRES